MNYFQTKNGIIKIGRYSLGEGYKVYKDPLGGSTTGGTDSADRKRPNSALLTYSSTKLLKAPDIIISKNVPTSLISVKTESAWDYVPNYEQNSFNVKRFTYEKPSHKTITLEGNYLAPSTLTAEPDPENPVVRALDNFYMFDTFVGEFRNLAAFPHAYSFSFKDTLHDKELFLGRGMLPESFNININGVNQVQDAGWSATFIGPYDFNDDSTRYVTPRNRENLGLRALNTRDFVLSCSSNNIMAAVIGFNLSLNIEWEKKATFISYLGAEAPNWRWWGMNNMTGTCEIKMLLPLPVVQGTDGSKVKDGNTYAWPLNRITWTDPTLYSLLDSDNSLSLPDFYWQTPSIDFQSENLAVLSYKGVLHNGTVIS